MSDKISIIIKTLNEETNIERAIRSALNLSKSLKIEVVVADSLSTDMTLEIAKKFPIKIVKLKDSKQRSCGIGAQLGYQQSSGDYIYILDGDMELEKGFLEKALVEFTKNPRLAGVGGTITEMWSGNIIFKRRQLTSKTEYGPVEKLEMGGLYRKTAIDDIGYLTNKNLHSYEEAELGFRLKKSHWDILRIKVPAVKHYGYGNTSFSVLKKRWKTGYVKGAGEFLRSSIGKGYFMRTCWELKLYLLVLFWWILLFASLISYEYSTKFLMWFASATFVGMLSFFFKKKSLKEFVFSLVSWNFTSLGLIIGFFRKTDDPKKIIPCEVLK